MEGGAVIHPYVKFGGRGCNLYFIIIDELPLPAAVYCKATLQVRRLL